VNKLTLLSDFLFSFKGRISRGPWWAVKLLMLPITIVLRYNEDIAVSGNRWGELLYVVIFLLVVWIDIAINAKRYHDINKTGWRQLVFLIPLLGGLWLLIECGFKAGYPSRNQYGYPNMIGRSSMHHQRPSHPVGVFDGWKDQASSNEPRNANRHDIYS